MCGSTVQHVVALLDLEVLSADATKGRIERLLEQGADAYLAKPIDVKQFLAVIHEHTPAPVLATSQADTLAR